jgi:hypothetical protein
MSTLTKCNDNIYGPGFRVKILGVDYPLRCMCRIRTKLFFPVSVFVGEHVHFLPTAVSHDPDDAPGMHLQLHFTGLPRCHFSCVLTQCLSKNMLLIFQKFFRKNFF